MNNVFNIQPFGAKCHFQLNFAFPCSGIHHARCNYRLQFRQTAQRLGIEARQTAIAMRRSTAGQIEYWAMLGKAVEEGGLTTREAHRRLGVKPSCRRPMPCWPSWWGLMPAASLPSRCAK